VDGEDESAETDQRGENDSGTDQDELGSSVVCDRDRQDERGRQEEPAASVA
jgi:hypothetical protein